MKVIDFAPAAARARARRREFRAPGLSNIDVHLAGASLHVTPDSFWLRFGKLGLSVCGADEDLIACQDVAFLKAFGLRATLVWLDLEKEK